MKVAIIGAGNVGKALGSSISGAGHEVVFASRGESAKTAAQNTGASSAGIKDAAKQADIVVLAIPYSAAREVASDLESVISGKVVIDVTNPLSADGSGLATEHGTSAAENIARWLPSARVVKAFNTMFASVQGNPKAHGQQLDALFATDDDGAREKVAQLLTSMGFRPVWVGPLSRARELEAMAFLNIALQLATNGEWQTTFVMVGAPKAALEHRAPAGSTNK
jgi:NADPH-dependent F420 reductase